MKQKEVKDYQKLLAYSLDFKAACKEIIAQVNAELASVNT